MRLGYERYLQEPQQQLTKALEQLQANIVGNMIQKAAIDPRAATRTGPGRIGIAARAGKMPQLLGDAVHVDRQAHPAIADQRDPQFFLPHRPTVAAERCESQVN